MNRLKKTEDRENTADTQVVKLMDTSNNATEKTSRVIKLEVSKKKEVVSYRIAERQGRGWRNSFKRKV